MQHIFIRSSVDGPLRCFPVLATVNSAAMNTGVTYLFGQEFCLDICQGVDLLVHMVILFLVF